MANLYTHKSSNVRKTWLLIAVFLVLIMVIGWVFSYIFESQVILLLAIILSITMSFVSYWWSDKLVLRMTKAKPVKKHDNPEFYRIMENLCITAGLPMPRLYILEESAPNAFATGRNPENSVVAVTRGLLEKLDRSELEGVLAHELAHIGNKDILVSTVVVVLSGIIIYAADILMRSFLWGGGRGNDRGGVAMIIIGIVALIISSLFATMLKMAVSRKREFLADATGALITRYPEGLASALEKISQDSSRMKIANDATAHLFFESPFKADAKNKKPGMVAKLFLTHPPVEERIKALRNNEY